MKGVIKMTIFDAMMIYKALMLWLYSELLLIADSFGLEKPTNPINLSIYDINKNEIPTHLLFKVRKDCGTNDVDTKTLSLYIAEDFNRDYPINRIITKVWQSEHYVYVAFPIQTKIARDTLCFDSLELNIKAFDCMNRWKFSVNSKEPFFILYDGKLVRTTFGINSQEYFVVLSHVAQEMFMIDRTKRLTFLKNELVLKKQERNIFVR